MSSRATHWTYLVISSMLFVLVAAGCYQPAPDAIQPTSQSVLVTNTPLPPPSETPLPTDLPTDLPTETETPTATETTAVDQPISLGETSVAQAEVTDDPFLQPTEVPLVDPNADPFQLTATAFVQQVTETVVVGMTQTADALGLGMSPTPTPTATIDPALNPAGATALPVSPGQNCIHQVRLGDTLFRLSLLYGVPVRDIANLSGVTNINQISVGQQLVIPGCGTTGAVPPPTSVPIPTSTPIVGVDANAQAVAVGPPQASGSIHVVEQYETLFQIALRYGVDVNDIALLNGIANINVITMGQELSIPQAR